MKKIFCLLISALILLTGCGLLGAKHEGYIIAKNSSKEHYSITVVSGINKNDISDNSNENIRVL